VRVGQFAGNNQHVLQFTEIADAIARLGVD